MEKKITKDEHYIPKFILRNHKNPEGKNPHIYRLDKNTGEIMSLSIGNECFERYLYELRKNGEIILPNEIENRLMKIEGKISTVIRNVTTSHSVDDKQLTQLYSFMISQIIRTPNALETLFCSKPDDTLTDEDWKNIIRYNIYPFDADINKYPIYKSLFDMFISENSTMYVVESPDSFILNGVNPVLVLYESGNVVSVAFYPFCKKHCLCVDHYSKTKDNHIVISPEKAKFINDLVFDNASKYIYSSEKSLLESYR